MYGVVGITRACCKTTTAGLRNGEISAGVTAWRISRIHSALEVTLMQSGLVYSPDKLQNSQMCRILTTFNNNS